MTSKSDPLINKTVTLSSKIIPNVNRQNWVYEPYFSEHKATLPNYVKVIEIKDNQGLTHTVTREDLLKYISERNIVESNEIVHQLYERYQVAVKLVRSDDDGNTGVRGT